MGHGSQSVHNLRGIHWLAIKACMNMRHGCTSASLHNSARTSDQRAADHRRHCATCFCIGNEKNDRMTERYVVIDSCNCLRRCHHMQPSTAKKCATATFGSARALGRQDKPWDKPQKTGPAQSATPAERRFPYGGTPSLTSPLCPPPPPVPPQAYWSGVSGSRSTPQYS